MSYTITNFSQTMSITVPDMPPGINTVDTSLNLVGKGYPNYGEKTAENFLYLLENFASPYPGPNNPIEGQLWYDTTDPNHKVLRVRDGINWSNASGIYQQSDDPRISAEAPARLRSGDIWVDTSNYQLKIFNNNNWTLVGPMKTEGSTTGVDIETIYGSADIPGIAQGHPIIKLWSEGDVVAIVTNKSFTPKSVIPGFPELVPGINLRKGQNTGDTPILNGTARTAQNLDVGGVVYSTTKFLRKDDSTRREFGGQVVTGKIFFKTPTDSINNEEFGQGEYGIVINNQASNTDSKYIQFYKGSNNAVILNNHPTGKIILKVLDNTSSIPIPAVESDYLGFTVNTPLIAATTATLQGNAAIVGNLSVGSTATISNDLIVNGVTVLDDTSVTGKLVIKRQDNFGSPVSGPALVPYTSGIYDIGSQTNYFNQIFVSYIGTSTTGTVVYGKVKGSATSLEYGTTFKIKGQIEANSAVFNGQQQTSTITYVERNSDYSKIKTSSPHNLITGTYITVECSSSSFDVVDTLIVSTTATSITYYNSGSNVTTSVANGTVYSSPLTFNSTLTSAAISGQQEVTLTNNLTFLALDTSADTLGKITFSNLVNQLYFTGMITAYGASTNPPAGWLLCNGASYSQTTYADLYNVIGNDFGSTLPGMFKVPDYTSTANGGYTIYYIIKT